MYLLTPYLKTAIITAAWAAVRVKDYYWRALFERLRKRMRVQKVIVAIARRTFKVVYKTLDTLTHYQEKGIAHFMDLQAKAATYHRMKQHGHQLNDDSYDIKRTDRVLEIIVCNLSCPTI